MFFECVEKGVFEMLEFFAFTGDLVLDALFLGQKIFKIIMKR